MPNPERKIQGGNSQHLYIFHTCRFPARCHSQINGKGCVLCDLWVGDFYSIFHFAFAVPSGVSHCFAACFQRGKIPRRTFSTPSLTLNNLRYEDTYTILHHNPHIHPLARWPYRLRSPGRGAESCHRVPHSPHRHVSHDRRQQPRQGHRSNPRSCPWPWQTSSNSRRQ